MNVTELFKQMGSYMGYFWIVMSFLFLFAELQTPGLFFFVSFAVGSLGAAIFAFLKYSLVIQCVAGLAISLITFFLMRSFLKKKRLSDVRYESSETNIDALVGKSGVVTSEIKPREKGQVKVGGEIWRAMTDKKDNGLVIERGAVVKILCVKGNTLIVRGEKS